MWRTGVIVLSVVSTWAACGKDERGDKAGGGAAGTTTAPVVAENKGATKRDPCTLVTQADATALFGLPAKKRDFPGSPDPNYLGQCNWEHEWPDGSTLLLQFNLWGHERYFVHDNDPATQPFAIGDKGTLAVKPSHFRMEWVQKGHALSLWLTKSGPSATDVNGKVEQFKALAKKVEAAY